MSVDEMRTKLLMLKEEHPNRLLLIRSEHDVDKIDIMNSELHGPFDFGDTDGDASWTTISVARGSVDIAASC